MKVLLALLFTTAFSGQVFASKIPALSCSGTEPFWNLKVNESSLKFDNLSSEEIKSYNEINIRGAANTTIDFVFQVEAKNKSNDVLKLSVFKTQCNDGMSDHDYAYTALVDTKESLYFGCCD